MGDPRLTWPNRPGDAPPGYPATQVPGFHTDLMTRIEAMSTDMALASGAGLYGHVGSRALLETAHVLVDLLAVLEEPRHNEGGHDDAVRSR